MSELEKYLVENRPEFDTDEPADGHFDRFKARLGNRQGRKSPFTGFLQIAASLAIVISGGLIIIQTNKSGDKIAVSNLPADVEEASEYYAHQVDYKYEQIAGYTFTSRKEKEVLLDELKEMDEYYQQLLEDLNANPGDERAINALITHYQMKLDVMDHILEQLNQLKTENNQTNQNNQSHEERL